MCAYDNVTEAELSRFADYYQVTVPESCIPYLVNGDTEGYSEEEIARMDEFTEKYSGKLSGGLLPGDCCVPREDASPSFTPYNDIYGWQGADTYRFALPCR